MEELQAPLLEARHQPDHQRTQHAAAAESLHALDKLDVHYTGLLQAGRSKRCQRLPRNVATCCATFIYADNGATGQGSMATVAQLCCNILSPGKCCMLGCSHHGWVYASVRACICRSSPSHLLGTSGRRYAPAIWPITLVAVTFNASWASQELAAAAIGSSFVGLMARTVLQGLCGALDTQASQVGLAITAAGSGVWHVQHRTPEMFLSGPALSSRPMAPTTMGQFPSSSSVQCSFFGCMLFLSPPCSL